MARTGFNKNDIARDACQLFGPQARQGYDGWWHSITRHDAETGEAKPSYLMVKAGAWSLMSLTFPRPGHGCILHSSAGKRKRRLSGTWSERSSSGRMITDVTCEKKDMLLVNYESPDGAKRHKRLWNGGNGVGTIQLFDRHDKLVDRVHAENIGCKHGEYDKLT